MHPSTQKACGWGDPRGFLFCDPCSPLPGGARAGWGLSITPPGHTDIGMDRHDSCSCSDISQVPRCTTFRAGLAETHQDSLICLSSSEPETKVWGTEQRPWVLTPQLSTGQNCQLLHGLLLVPEVSAGGQPSRPPPLGAPLMLSAGSGASPSAETVGRGWELRRPGFRARLGHVPAASRQVLSPLPGHVDRNDLRGTSGSECPGPDPLALGFPPPSPVPATRQSYRIRHHEVPKPRSLCRLPLLKRLTQKGGV